MKDASLSQALGRARLYDLSQPLFAGGPHWLGYPPPIVETTFTVETQGFNAEHLDIMSHTSTHLDVPYHFLNDGRKLDEVTVEEFQGPAVTLDLRPLRPSQGIGVEELERFADRIQPGDIVILCTGWGDIRSLDPAFTQDWPYLTGPGASWLVAHGARAVAIDTLSIGGASPEAARPAHIELLGAGCWVVEDIRVPPEVVAAGRCHLFAFPILIQGAGGAPVRVVAAVG